MSPSEAAATMASARRCDLDEGAMTSIRIVVDATSGNLRVAPTLIKEVTMMMIALVVVAADVLVVVTVMAIIMRVPFNQRRHGEKRAAVTQ
jgi:hypothetical protein